MSGVFPFVSMSEIAAARDLCERDRAVGHPSAGPCLFAAADNVVAEPSFARPLDLPLATNCFITQNLLLELSLAFCLSGDERYLAQVLSVVAGLADPSYRRDRLPSEVRLGFVLVGLIVAAELCGDDLDQALVHEIAGAIATDLVASSRTERWGERGHRRDAWNHSVVAFSGVGAAGLLCADRSDAADWTSEALDRLTSFFRWGVTRYGMTREGLAYAGFVFRNMAPFLLACRAVGLFDYRSPAANPYLERLRLIPRWYAMEVFPRGSWVQNINQTDCRPGLTLGGLLPMFGPLDPGLVSWVHNRLVGPAGDRSFGRDRSRRNSVLFESVLWPPAPDPVELDLPDLLADEDVGYLVERVRHGAVSGFSFNCGRYLGCGHDQSDNGAVTFYANDVPLLLDSGASSQVSEGSSGSSHGHNLVLIDGRGQLPVGRGTGVSGRIVRATSGVEATVVTADLLPSYNARKYHSLTHAVRHCVYGKQPFPYLLLIDDFGVARGSAAVFDQLFHTPNPSEQGTRQDGIDLVVELQDATSRLSIRRLTPGVVLGPEPFGNGIRPWPRHALWRIRRSGSHVVIATLVLPSQEAGGPEIVTTTDEVRGRIALAWENGNDHGLDVLRWRPGQSARATLHRQGRAVSGDELISGKSLIQLPALRAWVRNRMP